LVTSAIALLPKSRASAGPIKRSIPFQQGRFGNPSTKLLWAGANADFARCFAMDKLTLMNKLTSMVLSLLLAAPLVATAAPKPATGINAAFGNTVKIIDPDGRSRKIWLQPDGTWTGRSRRGLDLAGKWKLDGEKVCMSQSKPRLFGTLCQNFPTDPEMSVEAKDPSGTTVHLKLVKGHVET